VRPVGTLTALMLVSAMLLFGGVSTAWAAQLELAAGAHFSEPHVSYDMDVPPGLLIAVGSYFQVSDRVLFGLQIQGAENEVPRRTVSYGGGEQLTVDRTTRSVWFVGAMGRIHLWSPADRWFLPFLAVGVGHQRVAMPASVGYITGYGYSSWAADVTSRFTVLVGLGFQMSIQDGVGLVCQFASLEAASKKSGLLGAGGEERSLSIGLSTELGGK